MKFSRQIPEGYILDFEEYLFNTLQHRLTQSPDGWHSFYYLDDKKKFVLASWHLNVKDNSASSPYRATFGGIDFSKNLSQHSLSKFIHQVIASFSDVHNIAIKLAPSNHDQTAFSNLFQSLFSNGFQVNDSMLVSVLQVDSKSFESKINATKRNILRRSEELEARKLPLSHFSEVYNCIEQSQTERNYKLSLTENQLNGVIERNKDVFFLYGVFLDDQLIGGVISMLVKSDILYVFYAGHLKEYDKYSPLIKLYDRIYSDCQATTIRLMDLGSSEENGSTKQSLLDFKLSLGADCGLKMSLSRKLNEK